MLQVTTASSLSPLATALAGVLGEPLADPLAAEWVAVPSAAMGRWLALELARFLGASHIDGLRGTRIEDGEIGEAGSVSPRDDGVVANVHFTYPGALRQCVLGSCEARGLADPWQVDRLVWAVLDVLQAGQGDGQLGPMARLPDGVTWFARARRLADLFDRYALWRPHMVAQWHDGRDVDASGRRLADHQGWQPHVWRCVRRAVGVPSPPERLPELLEQLRGGRLPLEIPSRLAVFGVTAIPGGTHFLELLEALAVDRQVHLLLLDPSPVASERVSRGGVSSAGRRMSEASIAERAADPLEGTAEHPLLRSWGRPVRERNAVLATSLSPTATVTRLPDGAGTPARTVLERLQQDIRADRAPAGDFVPEPGDRSIAMHSCHGPERQVDVLRDAVTHLLAEDPALREEDIVVLCPAISQFAPLVMAGFGPSAEGSTSGTRAVPDVVMTNGVGDTAAGDTAAGDTAAGDTAAGDAAAGDAAAGDTAAGDAAAGDTAPRTTPAQLGPARPQLRYRIADRSLRETSPVLGALDSLLELVAGRCTVSDVLAFAAMAPVRHRFDFDDDALTTLEHWAKATNVRWGLDGPHRARWGLPGELAANSWRSGLDQVLMGVAVSDGDLQLAVGSIAPLGVEGDEIAVAGRFADLIAGVEQLVERAGSPRPVAQWCSLLADAVDQFFAVDTDTRWQVEQVEQLLRCLVDEAVVASSASTAMLTLADVRRLLADRLRGSPARSDFFRGGVTVTSLLPLRGLPYRVVCVLGLDEAALVGSSPAADGDDLVDAEPRPGDPDARGELRQALLHALLAAGERIVITRTGRDPRTNAPVPPSTACAELQGAVLATVASAWRADYGARLETVHPCQPFDARCFTPGALGRPGAWSFDPQALAAATAYLGDRSDPSRGSSTPRGAVLVDPTPARSRVVTLAELTAFLEHPVAFYLRERLGLFLARDDTDLEDDLFVAVSSLAQWAMADRLLTARVVGTSPDRWARVERARGQLPPGGFGELEVARLQARVDDLLASAAVIGVDADLDVRYPVDVVLEDGTHVVGTVVGGCGSDPPGPAKVTVSRGSPKQHLAAWLALLALTGTDPTVCWRSVVVRREEKGDGIDSLQLVVPGDTPAERWRRAVVGLTVAVDCYHRGEREAVPLFPKLSWALHRDRGIPEAWWTGRGQGDGEDVATRIAFGPVELEALLAVPAGHDDPPGPGPGRVLRYAHYLWGAVDETAMVL